MPFATPEQVAARMGRTEFTGTDLAQVNLLLDFATETVTAAVDKTDTWAAEIEALETIPVVLRNTCIELVVRVMQNPGGVRSRSEQLGAHSFSESFTDGASSLELTSAEEARVRRIVWGAGSGSARVGGIIDDVLENRLLGEQYGYFEGS